VSITKILNQKVLGDVLSPCT